MRIKIWIDPQHADGTVCEHKTKPSGKPRDPESGCTGRARYQVMCTEHGAVGEPRGLRVLAEPVRRAHRDGHATTPARAT
ncbi:hypothetical protein [Streptomyces sp. URMC 123]|uniref:hypothetical protein n=1 Tax=Streptomyces sp. URMC 123 TaxID=3423403 RepID=UPI003F1B00AC